MASDMGLPELAIIIPAYNCAQYIEGALRSCLEQTSPAAEIVVVNDGSEDNLAEVLQPFVESGAIRVIHQENQGISRARNRGIEASSAEIVTFLDADDELMPHANEVRQRAMQEFPEAGLVFGDYWMSDLPGEKRSIHQFLRAAEIFAGHVEKEGGDAAELDGEFAHEYAKQQLPSALMHTNCVGIRRSLLERIGTFRTDLAASQDYEMWRRCLGAAKGVVTRCSPYSTYFRWRGSIGKYEEECGYMVRGLREELAGVPRGSAAWRKIRRKIAREYLTLMWAHTALRSSRGKTVGTLLRSVWAYPVPGPQMKYAVRLLLPERAVRYAYRWRRTR